MLILREFVIVNLQFLTEIPPKFFNGVTLIFQRLQKSLHLFVVGCGAFNGSRFRGVLILFPNAANDPIQIAVDVMEEIFFFVNPGSVQNLNIQVVAFRVMLLYNLEPNCIQPVVHILNLYGGDAVHINFGVSHQL